MAKWIQKAVAGMKKKGTVGSFSAAAKRAGKSTSAMASSVLKPGSHASSTMRKKAQFAKNVAGGNTMLSSGSMKGHALAHDHADNLASKCDFCKGM